MKINKKRIAVVRKEKCNPEACGNLCAKLCPVNRTGKECIRIEDGKAVIEEALCTGCGICANRCPFKAISIINLPKELQHEPIHQYGMNGFHLFNLPMPSFGKVVGIVGRNGIGKTTAIKILAGILKPNLGNLNSQPDYKELIQYFKGTESQHFFELLSEGKIKVSYKPQQVEALTKMYDCTVNELLLKADKIGKLDEFVKSLSLQSILSNKISDVSGGELQRIAIAATFLNDADLYILDEPSSYLDIKQRLSVARFIRSMISPAKSIIVVEHDLIVLDYLADLIHILYGESGVYGVVSSPISAREGINSYLSGYIKEENVRFRDYELKFYSRPEIQAKSSETLIEWTPLKKKMGNFSLEAEEGKILKKTMTGLLGENGIGKTTFMRMLAGELKPDEGNINEAIKIAYKPQYIEIKEDMPVSLFLKEAIQKYSTQLIKPLELDELKDRMLSELSGGELQRVMIASTLAKDADIYLFDEPSAYLDVEQRLSVAKIISNILEVIGKACAVIDHDLLFLDTISSNLLIFHGKPALHGIVKGPFTMEEGMTIFLSDLGITFRRDKDSRRPRANKEGSRLDVMQKAQGRYFY